MIKNFVFALMFIVLQLDFANCFAKELAFTFDDAPVSSSQYYESGKRADELIRKLNLLNISGAMIFANPCKDKKNAIAQLRKYVDAGHFIANHTCTHPRLDEVGFLSYSKDAAIADQYLTPLMAGQKFFRFPFLNEGKDTKLRDQMRNWLKDNQYRNGMVSIDNDDYLVSWAINKAKEKGKEIDFEKVKGVFLRHLLGAVDFYDDLAVKKLGYSPKHVILLHEVDATVMFIDALVNELRKKGWKIISATEAYGDKLYLEQPQNTFANNGIVAQVVLDRTGKKAVFDHFNELKAELIEVLGL